MKASNRVSVKFRREKSFGDAYDPDEHGTKIAWLCQGPLELVQRIKRAQEEQD